MIISGPTAETSDYYRQIRKFIPHLKKQDREGTEEEPLLDEERGHYLIDEKNRSIELTDDGYILVEDLLEQGMGDITIINKNSPMLPVASRCLRLLSSVSHCFP